MRRGKTRTLGSTNMRIAHALAAMIVCVGAIGCDRQGIAPARPANVPPTAVWAGGADGGAWIDCVALERAPYRYRCTTYDDHSGSMWAQGEYVLRAAQWHKDTKRVSFEPATQVPSNLQYSSFDGEVISLAQPLVLVPDGWIKYPFEKGGKKQMFEMGQARSEE